MSKSIEKLITQIIEAARAQGLSQAELAQRAGLSAVGLSKAKHRGDIRASTLSELANQLDLQLVLRPRQASPQAVDAIKAGTFLRSTRQPAEKSD
ncbi:MAG: hypothetical protein P8Z75_09335 [Gammaproteobacteria bacterium]